MSVPAPGSSDSGGYTGLHVINVLLLAVLWVGSGLLWSRLPERVPGHIGLTGVTRWVDRSAGIWFLQPLLGTFSAFLMYVLARTADAGAAGLNVPRRKELLKLPLDGQRFVLQPLRGFMFALAGWVLLLLAWVQWMMFRAAVPGPAWQQGRLLLAGAVVLTVLPVLGAIRWNRLIRERLELWRESAGSVATGIDRADAAG